MFYFNLFVMILCAISIISIANRILRQGEKWSDLSSFDKFDFWLSVVLMFTNVLMVIFNNQM